MNDREFFCKRHRVEFSTFQRVLGAMPPEQFNYRPHERSPSAHELVWTLACEMSACITMTESGEVHWCPPSAPLPVDAVKVFQTNYEALDERVNRLSDEEWTSPRSSLLTAICIWSLRSASFSGTCFLMPFTTADS